MGILSENQETLTFMMSVLVLGSLGETWGVEDAYRRRWSNLNLSLVAPTSFHITWSRQQPPSALAVPEQLNITSHRRTLINATSFFGMFGVIITKLYVLICSFFSLALFGLVSPLLSAICLCLFPDRGVFSDRSIPQNHAPYTVSRCLEGSAGDVQGDSWWPKTSGPGMKHFWMKGDQKWCQDYRSRKKDKNLPTKVQAILQAPSNFQDISQHIPSYCSFMQSCRFWMLRAIPSEAITQYQPKALSLIFPTSKSSEFIEEKTINYDLKDASRWQAHPWTHHHFWYHSTMRISPLW